MPLAFFAALPAAWAEAREHIPAAAWSDALIITDLRWLEDAIRWQHPIRGVLRDTMPSLRELGKLWGCSTTKVRAWREARADWADPEYADDPIPWSRPKGGRLRSRPAQEVTREHTRNTSETRQNTTEPVLTATNGNEKHTQNTPKTHPVHVSRARVPRASTRAPDHNHSFVVSQPVAPARELPRQAAGTTLSACPSTPKLQVISGSGDPQPPPRQAPPRQAPPRQSPPPPQSATARSTETLTTETVIACWVAAWSSVTDLPPTRCQRDHQHAERIVRLYAATISPARMRATMAEHIRACLAREPGAWPRDPTIPAFVRVIPKWLLRTQPPPDPGEAPSGSGRSPREESWEELIARLETEDAAKATAESSTQNATIAGGA